jgi:peptidyl-tRNA hydrolase
VLTNVRSRGTWGEVQLGNLLEQTLTAEQYAKNVATRPGSRERVSPHVLSRPSTDDRIRIDRCIDEALRALPEAVKGNWPIAMNTLNSFKVE